MTIMNNGGKMRIFRYVLVLSCLLSVTACGQKKIPVDSVVFVADEKKISQSPMVLRIHCLLRNVFCWMLRNSKKIMRNLKNISQPPGNRTNRMREIWLFSVLMFRLQVKSAVMLKICTAGLTKNIKTWLIMRNMSVSLPLPKTLWS